MNEQGTTASGWTAQLPGVFRNRPRVAFAALVVLAVAIGILVWLVVARSNNSSSSNGPVAIPIAPVALSAGGLTTLAGVVGQPIYWAGRRRGDLYELRRADNGNVYIRYLPSDIPAGASGDYTTVATYPFKAAFQALRNLSNGRHVRLPGGGLAFVNPKYTKSIHLAYPGVDYQVEVYDPVPGHALAMARAGTVRPVVR